VNGAREPREHRDGFIGHAAAVGHVACRPIGVPGVTGELVWNDTDMKDAVAMGQ